MIFLNRFSKHNQISKSRPPNVGAELFHAEGRTDGQPDRETEKATNRHDEAVSRIWQFCERA